MTGMAKSALSEIENGKRNSYLLTLKLIADNIDVDVKGFL
jgi:transcriptional regulator with XRE-family HTH domain